MKYVFVIAMDCEAEAALAHFENPVRKSVSGRTVHEGRFRGEDSEVIVAGIGKVNAAAATQLALDRYAAETVVNIGVAGGIDASMKVADVFQVSQAFQCDFDLSIINGTKKGTVNEYDTPYFELAPLGDYPKAICSSGDFFANDGHDYGFVHDEMGAWLRDMELGAIAHVCKRAGVKCVSLKSVSDVNVPGLPPPATQYSENLKLAVASLTEAVGRGL